MAVGVYMVRYPLGGMLSMSLQLLVGLQRLGHEVFAVEKSGWVGSCFDVSRGVMTDDCSYGVAVVGDLLGRYGLGASWCYVDHAGGHHGMTPAELRRALGSCDAFIDAGTHGVWLEDLPAGVTKVLLDGEPGRTQMRWATGRVAGRPQPEYDVHLTVGQNLGTDRSTVPPLDLDWKHVFYPILLDEFAPLPADEGAAFTTIMNWQAHETLEFEGQVFGQKDVEFARFIDLPTRAASAPLELAVAGRDAPRERLEEAGWRLRAAHEVTRSYDTYRGFVRRSRGEFSVAKHVFVATNSGWFGDRSAAYLAAGRPVVVQDTGIRDHLPCGEGLFAVADVDEAAAALEEIQGDYSRHSRAAREVAREFLSAERVLPALLELIGL
jgi:hypothetical protein